MESVLLTNLTSTNNLTFEVLATDCACVCVYIWCMRVLKSNGIYSTYTLMVKSLEVLIFKFW